MLLAKPVTRLILFRKSSSHKRANRGSCGSMFRSYIVINGQDSPNGSSLETEKHATAQLFTISWIHPELFMFGISPRRHFHPEDPTLSFKRDNTSCNIPDGGEHGRSCCRRSNPTMCPDTGHVLRRGFGGDTHMIRTPQWLPSGRLEHWVQRRLVLSPRNISDVGPHGRWCYHKSNPTACPNTGRVYQHGCWGDTNTIRSLQWLPTGRLEAVAPA
jgi:hypothetical protein